MQDHFIKDVNELSLWMTFSRDRAGANRRACVTLGAAVLGAASLGHYYHSNERPGPLWY